MKKKKLKIAVGMSGGVDSSVSALLLKGKGYEVEGFFMKFWADQSCRAKRENSCCDSKSLKIAREVATKIGIPFHVVDVKDLFKKIVVDNFISDYKNLRTPNPCIGCNKYIKFGWFWEFAKALDFDRIATGHYCRINKGEKLPYRLLAGLDAVKDQSYFLYRLGQGQLSKIMFPLGDMTKKEVRKIARDNGLRFEDIKESQEICFIKDNYRNFLKRQAVFQETKAGNIVDVKREVIGTHSGLMNYTIGQRKGIDQSKTKDKNRKPLYVIGFREKRNELIVGCDSDVFQSELVIKKVAWISAESERMAKASSELVVKIRYRQKPARGKILADADKKLKVVFDEPQRAVAPGQHAVFYIGEEILGGGVIE